MVHLCNLTLLPASSISQAVIGNFSGARTQEICAVRGGTRLELLRLDKDTGKMNSVLATEAFGTIRCIQPFRLTGGSKDFLIIGSDSGRIVVAEHDTTTNSWKKLHEETYGKSGSRRIVPGQHVAIDPKGRSVMIGALEKSKFVYILNRDAAANLTISSPLEAHKAQTIIHSIVGVDVGFENPLFACLEVDYSESDQDPTGAAFESAEKMLTYYELDLGLNHVVRKWSDVTDSRANMLIPVPGGQSANSDHFDGPSGVLICTEDHVIYKHQGAKEHRIPIPRRDHPLADPERRLLITSYAMYKARGGFFFLLQNEDGDIFKLTMDRDEEELQALKIKYFDTVPTAVSLCILRSGFLFVASEFGNHQVYQFVSLGEDGGEVSSTDYPDNGAIDGDLPSPTFTPRALQNLSLVDELDSLAPIVDARVMNLIGADTPQIYAACGRGPRSSLRTLRHGLEVAEIAQQELSFRPNGIWATKAKHEDNFDSYVVLSAPNATLTFSVGESIETVDNTGIRPDVRTLGIQLLADNTLVQVHPRGLELIHSDGRRTPTPVKRGTQAVSVTSNARQIVVALSTGELAYYLLQEGQLTEYSETKDMGVGITAISLAELPEGRLITPYLAVGCEDSTVRILSLDFENCLETLSIQALTAPPTSLCMVHMLDTSIDKVHPTLFVNIGLQTGVLLRTVLDAANGELTDTRTRFLGTRQIGLRRMHIAGHTSVLAMSSRSWLNYPQHGMLQFSPLIFDALDYASGFSAELCPDGVIAITDNVLRIFTLPKIDVKVQQTSIPLSYTPRKIATHPGNSYLYLVEADHRVLSPSAQLNKLSKIHSSMLNEEVLELPVEQFGRPKAEAGNWASCISIYDVTQPPESALISRLELEDNEAAFSVAVVEFASAGGAPYLVVGTAKETIVSPRAFRQAYINTYQISPDGKTLSFVHKTEVDDVPTSLVAFQGRLLAGVGKILRIYELGRKKLLRKVENKNFQNPIISLKVMGERIIVGDQQDACQFAVYKAADNRLLLFADDFQQRWTTAATFIDYETVAGGDKFGNIWVSRLPNGVSDQVDTDTTGAGLLHAKGLYNGAPHKLNLIAHFNIGDIVTSIHKASLVAGGRDVIIYTGLSGTVGMLVPLSSKDDIEFFQTLEMQMRGDPSTGVAKPSLVGRDHLMFRGYYAPQKATVDGDLCEAYAKLPQQQQAAIAEELARTVGEVMKKLENTRIAASGW